MRILRPHRPRQALHHPWIAEAHDNYRSARSVGDVDGRVHWWREYTRRRTAWVDWLIREGLYGKPLHIQEREMHRFPCCPRKRDFAPKSRA